MHGEIDATGQHRLVDFLAEQPFAPYIGEAAILNLIAGGADHHDLAAVGFSKSGHRRGEARACDLGLSQRQGTAARADANAAASHRLTPTREVIGKSLTHLPPGEGATPGFEPGPSPGGAGEGGALQGMSQTEGG